MAAREANGKKRSIGRIEVTTDRDDRLVMKVFLTGELAKEDGQWVAYCAGLDLSTCAATREKALANAAEAIQMWFESCLRRGTLAAALHELGWPERSISLLLVGRLRRPPTVTPRFRMSGPEKKRWSGRVELRAA
jgi:predicted RNase H-like HicB family nuclease